MFKNNIQMVVYIIIFIILICLFIYFGKIDYKNEIPDNIKFSTEYNLVGTDNVFKYVNAADVNMIASGKKGIVLFGNPSSKWVNSYASIVNDVAKEVGIKEIFYYDFFSDRDENNGTYETIVNSLGNYITYTDISAADLYAPTLLVVANDKILYFDSETSFITGTTSPKDYWNEFNTGLKKNTLKEVFTKYMNGSR